MKLLRYSVLFLLAGCMSKTARENQAVQADKKLAAVIAPEKEGGENDPSAISFIAAIRLTEEQLDMQKNLAVDLQYGVDSSFYILSGRDTLWPNYVMPVANGQPLHPQYIVGFQRPDAGHASIEFRANVEGLEEINNESVAFTANELKNPSK